ncbi:MAG: TOBE domain-containing protein, partial [Pseudomonadota bacterium]
IAVMRGGIIQQLADPKTIYNKPANLFVAGFIGSPAMSKLEAVGAEGGVQFGDLHVPLAGYDGGQVVPGQKVILGVRPEHITVEPEGVGLPAVVDLDEPMGSDSLLWLTIAGQQISVRIPADAQYAAGQKVGLTFDIAKSSVFDVESEARI